MTDTQLKPCPFCGSLAESALYQDDRWIECPRCQQGISGDADCITAEALIDIWNTRPIEDALQARIAELEKTSFMWHPFSVGEVYTYPPKTSSYLCYTRAGIIELCWNELQRDWSLMGSRDHIYNPHTISHWAQLPTPPEEQ